MSKTYNLLADSFTEIINDYKNNDGKNLTHDQISIIEEKNQIQERSICHIIDVHDGHLTTITQHVHDGHR